MKFTVNVPRYIAETHGPSFFNLDKEAAIISITQPDGDGPAKLNEGWGIIHRVSFWDVLTTVSLPVFLKDDSVAVKICDPISEEQAKDLADFIKNNYDRSIIVHCQAGVSRSAGVVRLLLDLGWAKHPFEIHGLNGYNSTVYNKLKRNFPNLLPIGA